MKSTTNLKRKRNEEDESKEEYLPPKKLARLDEDQIYIEDSTDSDDYDGSTTDGDLSSEEEPQATTQDFDFLQEPQKIPLKGSMSLQRTGSDCKPRTDGYGVKKPDTDSCPPAICVK